MLNTYRIKKQGGISQKDYIMNLKSLSPICAGVVLAMGAIPAIAESNISSNRIIFCARSDGALTTMAKTVEGKNLSIFHWRAESLPKSSNLQQLCNSVSIKLNKYVTQGSTLASFGSYEQMGIPTVCAEAQPEQCSLVLFTLAPTDNPINQSNQVLEAILDDKFKQGKQVSHVRGLQAFTYNASFFQLFMPKLKLIK